MKRFQMVPMGAALLALGLGLSSAVPAPASARDQGSANRSDQMIIRAAQDDRDRDSDDSGYLGVQVQRLSSALRRAKGIPESTEGTLVSGVEDGSPADNAGIKRGDVITSVDHQDTANPADLVRVVRDLNPGRRVSVQVWRDGVTRSYTLKVGSRPATPDAPTPPSWNGPGDDNMPPMPDGSRMQILRRNRDDLERQLHDLQAQVQRLENEIHELQMQMNRMDHDDHGRDRDNDRDRDRDNSNDDD